VTADALARWLGEVREEQVPPPLLLSDYLKHLSASSIGMLFRCPRQFRHRYLLHEKERPGEGMVVGSFFHKTLEWNYLQKIKSGVDYPLSDAVQYLQDVAVPQVLEEEGGEDFVRWDTNLDQARGDAHRITGAYYYTVVPHIQPTGVEERFEIEFPGVEIPVIGYLDTVEEQRILDTKTGRAAVKKVKPSWQLQGRLYSYASRKPTEFHSISKAQTPNIVTALQSDQMVVPVPSPEQAQEMTRLVNTAADLLRYFLTTLGVENEWPTWGAIPDFTRNVLPCDFCGWKQGCPAWT